MSSPIDATMNPNVNLHEQLERIGLRTAHESNHARAVDTLTATETNNGTIAGQHEGIGVVDEKRPVVIAPRIVPHEGYALSLVAHGLQR